VDFLDLAVLLDQWQNRAAHGQLVWDLATLADQWLDQVGPLVISEFMARNQDTLLDGDGESSDWIEIRVSDQGIGLTEDEQKNLFHELFGIPSQKQKA